jgi:hypothetical protein
VSALAQIAGLPKQTLSGIEQGTGNPAAEPLSAESNVLRLINEVASLEQAA